MEEIKKIQIQKGIETYIFKCKSGEENIILESLVDMVDNIHLSFGISDAIYVAYNLGKE